MSDYRAFGEAEREGWSDPVRVSGYVDLFLSAADQTTDSLLSAAGATAGRRALDLCCGQGNVSKALVDRGCTVVGLDFSPAMLERARARVPEGRFLEGDAQDMPLKNGYFDIVVSNFGVCHAADQPRVLAEIRRVLRPGGIFAMTVWCGPEASPCFEVVYESVKAHGSPEVSPPPAPDFHQFARRDVAEKLLSDAGFSDVRLQIVDCAWELDAPERLVEIFEKGTVRAAMLLARQPEENLAAIRAAVTELVRERFADGGVWRVPMPATLVRASA